MCTEYFVHTFPFLAVVLEIYFIFLIGKFSELFHLLIPSVTPSPPLLLSHYRLWGVLTLSHKTVFSPTSWLYLAGALGYQRSAKTKTKQITARDVTALSPLFLEVCTNTYAGGTVVEGASGMELTTRLGAAAGSGGAAGFAATTGLSHFSMGQSGTMRTRHSTGGTNKDFGEGAINMKFLDSYFSQVIWWKTLWLCYLVYIRDLST